MLLLDFTIGLVKQSGFSFWKTHQRVIASFAPWIAAASVLMVLVYTMTVIRTLPDYDITWIRDEQRVIGIHPNGSADQAGVQQDDQIVRVNGTPAAILMHPYYNLPSGSPVTLTVDRAGSPLVLSYQVPEPPVMVPLDLLSPFTVAFFFWATGIVVWLVYAEQPSLLTGSGYN